MKNAIDYLLGLQPFGTSPQEKDRALRAAMEVAIRHHASACAPYRRFLDRRGFDPERPLDSLADIPFLPAPIFRSKQLLSVPPADVVRTLASSGSSSQTPSRVALDGLTRARQMKALAAVLKEVCGAERRPFLVCDIKPNPQVKDMELSARVAGVRGYLMAASEINYVMKQEAGTLTLSRSRLLDEIKRLSHTGQSFCILAYTYVLYQHVVLPLLQAGAIQLPKNAKVIHFGGWKRLLDQAVPRAVFMDGLTKAFGIEPQQVYDIYGFTEQLGVVYPDDGFGVKRIPVFAEVIIRDPITLEVLPEGETGFLEFVTPLPHSYPGVAVLLDDMGRLVRHISGENGEPTLGIELMGRAARAEIRGCGDTLPERYYQMEL